MAGHMDLSEARRRKALEQENAKLKKFLVAQMLDGAALRELDPRLDHPQSVRACAKLN